MDILNDLKTRFNDIKNDPKKLIIAISAVVGIALLLYTLFVLKPQIVNIAETRGKLGKINADLKSARADIANMGTMKSAVEAYNKKMSDYDKALPSEDKIPALLESLSEMANSADMRIAGIVPVAAKEVPGAVRVYREIPINITGKAGYHEVGRFITSIENSDRFMKVTDIQIKGDKASPRMHNVDLTVVAYVMQEGK